MSNAHFPMTTTRVVPTHEIVLTLGEAVKELQHITNELIRMTKIMREADVSELMIAQTTYTTYIDALNKRADRLKAQMEKL